MFESRGSSPFHHTYSQQGEQGLRRVVLLEGDDLGLVDVSIDAIEQLASRRSVVVRISPGPIRTASGIVSHNPLKGFQVATSSSKTVNSILVTSLINLLVVLGEVEIELFGIITVSPTGGSHINLSSPHTQSFKYLIRHFDVIKILSNFLSQFHIILLFNQLFS